MSLHKLINLCQHQAGRLIGTNAMSTASDAWLPTAHQLCALHFISAKIAAAYQAPRGWVTLVTTQLLPRIQLLSSFPSAHFKLTLQTCRLCVAELQALLLTLSMWTHLHHAAGKKGKQLTCVPCRTAPSALRLPQLRADLVCSVDTQN